MDQTISRVFLRPKRGFSSRSAGDCLRALLAGTDKVAGHHLDGLPEHISALLSENSCDMIKETAKVVGNDPSSWFITVNGLS